MNNKFFNGYPYTDFHELNLSWVIDQLRAFATTLEQFVSINALKYADPIQWDITSQYEKNTIVIDPQTGTAYISVDPVPVGVALNNTDYWTEVFNLGGFIVRSAQNFANTYEADTTLTATVSTPKNGWIVWGDVLYKALVNITAGDTYVVGSNIAHFTIEDVAGHLEDLTTTNKNNLVEAINEVATGLASEIITRGNADTSLNNAITAEVTNRSNADTALSNRIQALERSVVPNMWHGKKVVVYGDSLSTVTHQYWQYMVEADPTIDVTNRAEGGTRIQDGVILLTAATSADLSQFDIIVLAYGTNSWANTSLREMINRYKDAFSILATKAPNAQVVTIAPYYSYNPNYGADSINDLGFAIYDYSTAICHISNMFGITTFNLYESTGVNQFNFTDYLEESSGGIYVHENEALGRKIADILLTGHPYTGTAKGYTYISMGDGVGLLIIKANYFTIIVQRGIIPYSAFADVAIPHIAPAYNASGFARNQATGEIGLVAVNTTSGEFTFAFASGDTPTNIQGLQIIGLNGSYQPADV